MKIAQIRDLNYIIVAWLIVYLFVYQLPLLNAALGETNEPETAPEIVQEPKEIIYIIKPGDSLNRVADKYKVLLSDLIEWNGIQKLDRLQPGQQILVKEVNYEPREGLASWYGPNFHGKRMANTEVFNMNDMVVAHRTLPLGRKVKVTNLENGKSIIAPVLDRGPYVKNSSGEYTREIDLSYAVAKELGTIQKGVVRARVEPINEPLF